jgi:hypothetical protein
VCYAQGADVDGAVTGSPAGNTQQPPGHGTGGAAAADEVMLSDDFT